MSNPFLVLGIDEDATQVEIDDAFRYLSKNLNPTNFPSGGDDERQAQLCMPGIVAAYQVLRDPVSCEPARAQWKALRGKPFDPIEFKPFLGHICVAAGIITLEDLNDAVSRQSDIDLPLGQILQEKALLSQTELEGLLMGQRLFGAPNRPLDRFTERLLALSLVTRDMVKIVLIDQRTNFMRSLPDLLVQRQWVSQQIIQVLHNQKAKQPSSMT